MRISAKGRYAVAAMIDIARNSQFGECVTVASISQRLGISKIYLEQVFALLKKGGLVNSVKGAQGGYLLARQSADITVFDILKEAEAALFERTQDAAGKDAPEINSVMRALVFDTLDHAIENALKKTTLYDLAAEADLQKGHKGYMFFI